MRAPIFEVVVGDVLEVLRGFPERSIQTVITSPPYWGLRSYLPKDHPDKHKEIGTEKTPQEYVEKIVSVFREVRRVLRDDGTMWLNLGDSYTSGGWTWRAPDAKDSKGGRENDTRPGTPEGLKEKDLVGIPWSVALALRADGWWLRADIIWAKGTSGQKSIHAEAANAMREEGVDEETIQRVLARWEPYVGNCMPSSVEDRPTSSHEYVFLLTKGQRYFYDHYSVREEAPGHQGNAGTFKRHGSKREQVIPNQSEGTHRPTRDDRVPAGRNIRTVWTIPTTPFPGSHFATFPEKLVTPMIRAGSSEGGCCAKCGAPRKRVVEKGEPLAEQKAACGADAMGGYSGESTKGHAANGVQDASAVKARVLAGMVAKRTVAWVSPCECRTPGDVTPGQNTQPCLVLDPFCGSGTVGAVCMREGRDFVGIELFQENADMARARIPDPDYARKVRVAKNAEKAVAPAPQEAAP